MYGGQCLLIYSWLIWDKFSFDLDISIWVSHDQCIIKGPLSYEIWKLQHSALCSFLQCQSSSIVLQVTLLQLERHQIHLHLCDRAVIFHILIKVVTSIEYRLCDFMYLNTASFDLKLIVQCLLLCGLPILHSDT